MIPPLSPLPLRVRCYLAWCLIRAAWRAFRGLRPLVNIDIQETQLRILSGRDAVILETLFQPYALTPKTARAMAAGLLGAANAINPDPVSESPSSDHTSTQINGRGFGDALPESSPRVAGRCGQCKTFIAADEPYHVEEGGITLCVDCHDLNGG